MSDNEVDRELGRQTFDDDHAHQACYIFEPSSTDDLDQEKPAQKRRKTKSSPEEHSCPFPLLSHGAEPAEFAQLRHETYQKVWARKKARIDELVNKVDETALVEIVKFTQSTKRSTEQRLRTGLVISGPDGAAQTRLLERWRTSQYEKTPEVVIQLQASYCVNLQTTLKNIIKSTITAHVGQDGYQSFLNKHKRLIPMNYDLELLQTFVQEQEIQRVVLSVLDVETFDIGIFSELISTLSLWSETIPFVVLLGIATTVELFESRLPKSTIDLLDTTTFTLQSSGDVLKQILNDTQHDPDQGVKFGPWTASSLEDLTQSQGITIKALTNAIKYAIMSHFFANSLSVLLGNPSTLHPDQSLCTAIRNTTSFQRHCEALLRTKSKASNKLVSDLLTNDTKLLDISLQAIKSDLQSATSDDAFILPEATTLNSRSILTPFAPRPRHALERALATPADYLGCSCCQTNATSPTPLLSTLLQEAGTIVNVRDLYDAFCARCFPVNADDQDDEEEPRLGGKADREHLSVFYTALAELRMLGLIKGSTSAVVKKRAVAAAGGGGGLQGGIGRGRDRYGDVDFIAKTGWAGL